MSAEIINGRDLAKELRSEMKAEIAELNKNGIQPHLTVILVGNDPASQSYVNGKKKASTDVAVGRPNVIGKDHVKDGAVVIDVGVNRLDDGSLTGDVDFDQVKKKASFITPVPQGVGPMTITMLLHNTIQAAKGL